MLHFANRILKSTLRGSGGNLTHGHIEDVSLAALFLLEATKKTDIAFGALNKSTGHTVRDANRDINKICNHLIEKAVTKEDKDRDTPAFVDPIEVDWKKMCTTTWIQDTLARSQTEDLQPEREHDELDIDYELDS